MTFFDLSLELLLQGEVEGIRQIFFEYEESEDKIPKDWNEALFLAFFYLISGRYLELKHLPPPITWEEECFVNLINFNQIKILGLIRNGDYNTAKTHIGIIEDQTDKLYSDLKEYINWINGIIKTFWYIETGDLAKAKAEINKTKEIPENPSVIPFSIHLFWKNYRKNNHGLFYSYVGKFEKAISLFNEVIDSLQGIPYCPVRFFSLLNLAYCYQMTGRPDLAIHYLENAVEAIQHIGNESDLPYVLRELGNANLSLDNMEKAIDFFSQAYNLSKQFNHAKLQLERGLELHNSLLRHNKVDQAYKLLEELKEIASKHQDLWFSSIIDIMQVDQCFYSGRLIDLIKKKERLMRIIENDNFPDFSLKMVAWYRLIKISIMEFRVMPNDRTYNNLIREIDKMLKELEGSNLKSLEIQTLLMLLTCHIEYDQHDKAFEVINKLENVKNMLRSRHIREMVDEEIKDIKELLIQTNKEVIKLTEENKYFQIATLEKYVEKVGRIFQSIN